MGWRASGVRTVELPCRGLPDAADNNRARRLLQTFHEGGRDFMKKKLTLSKETLRTLDEQELSLVVGAGNASGAHNPAQCPSSHHPNCK